MAGFPWLKVSSDLREHEKSVRLAALLRDKRAWSYVVGLWMWCADQEGSGHIEGDEARAMVEFGAGWDGKPGVLVNALLKAGFIEDDGRGGIVVHDWVAWQERHVEKRAKDRARQARHRATKAGVTPHVTSSVTRDTHRDVTRDPSKENQRVEIQERSEEEEPQGARAPKSSAAEDAGRGKPRTAPASSAPKPAGSGTAEPDPSRAARGGLLATVPAAHGDSAAAATLSDDDLPRRKLEVVDLTDGWRPKPAVTNLHRQLVFLTRRSSALLKLTAEHEQLAQRLDAHIERIGFKRALAAALEAGENWPGGHAAIAHMKFYANAVLAVDADQAPATGGETEPRAHPLLELLRSRLRPDLYARWFSGMVGRWNGEMLELVTGDEYSQRFVAENYAEVLARLAAEVGVPDVRVVLEQPQAAAGGVSC